MYEKYLFPQLSKLCIEFLSCEAGDGDVCIFTSQNLNKIAEFIMKDVETYKFNNLILCEQKDENTILISDKSNENIVITNSWDVFNNTPDWPGLMKIQLDPPKKVEKGNA